MKKALIVIAIVLMVSSLAWAELAGYWTFDEGSGSTAADSSGNSKNGTFYAADSANYPQWITGHIGNALQFNASTTGYGNYNKVNVPIVGTDALANLTNQAFTVAMWVRRDAGSYSVVEPGLVGTDKYEVDLATDPCATGLDGHDYVYRTDTVTLVDLGLETAEQKTLGSWYHYAVAYDGTTMRKYVNGALVSSAAVTVDFNAVSSGNFMIASNYWDAYFKGALDDVAVWTGKYLKGTEIAKLANETETPLTVVESAKYIAPVYYMETNLFPSGWSALWNQEFNWSMTIVNNHPVWNSYWHFNEPNSRQAILPDPVTAKWYVKNEANYVDIPQNISKCGLQWIDSSWNGREPNMTVMAAYITPGMVLGQKDWDYSLYTYFPYFRCNIRMAAENANGASARVTVYKLASNTVPTPANYSTLMTYLGEEIFPLNTGNHNWQTIEFILPKANSPTNPKLWFEIALVGGDANTVLFVDAIKPASDRTVTIKPLNFNKDSFIDYQDINSIIDEWLVSGNISARTGGMLVNGDFYQDIGRFGPNQVPTGWDFTQVGTPAGQKGIVNVDNSGYMNYFLSVSVPLGGTVGAYTTDPNYFLEQTATETAVAGQTYYALAYIMTNSWAGWKDIAILSLEVDGTEVARFMRPMSLNRWRPIYGTYTATAQDAGKLITVKLSYIETIRFAQAGGYMAVGYVYLDNAMPTDWPDKRDNLLTNGGFEQLPDVIADLPDIENLDPETLTLNQYFGIGLMMSDNSVAFFRYPEIYGDLNLEYLLNDGTQYHPVDYNGILLPPGWLYEVPTGLFDDPNNEPNLAGLMATGMYGSPLPSPGMHDLAVCTSNDVVVGQIIGSLSNGTTYYVDMACGIIIDPRYNGSYNATWPNPAPQFHLELWRIPSGVTDGNEIHTGITTSQSGYVKVKDIVADANGDIKGGSATPPASTWQLIGSTYTATSSDTNVYLRIYGTNPPTGMNNPAVFVFSDVFVSTEKREVPGGSRTFKISSGMQYDVLGPYSCSHAALMGFNAPKYDLNGDCTVNFVDFATFAEQWLEIGFY